MMKREFPIPLERWLTGFGILAILLGAVLIAFVGWKTLGAVVVVYGLLSLFLAYHMGDAPCLEELETGDLILSKSNFNAEFDAKPGEMQPDWLADYKARNLAH
jgi:hypothetical protein